MNSLEGLGQWKWLAMIGVGFIRLPAWISLPIRH
jgi:hypothetical protein